MGKIKINGEAPSSGQKEMIETILDWQKNPIKNRLVISGYAGTGKTSALKYIYDSLFKKVKVKVMTFTGKAANVLNNKEIPASTIHSFLYEPIFDDDGDIVGWAKKDLAKIEEECEFMIVDEYSSVSAELVEDLESFGIPVLYVGDHGQLPPINGSNGLKEQTSVYMEELLRQSANNPIIKYASMAREGVDLVKKFPKGINEKNDSGMFAITNRYNKHLDKALLMYDQVLVATNKDRTLFNNKIRKLKGFDGKFPQKKELLINLVNNKDFGIFNGQQFYVKSRIKKSDNLEKISLKLNYIGGYEEKCNMNIEVDVSKAIFRGETLKKAMRIKRFSKDDNPLLFFDFGYAITGHKSQGSEWENVIGIDGGRWLGEDYFKWLYTVITRASKKFILIK